MQASLGLSVLLLGCAGAGLDRPADPVGRADGDHSPGCETPATGGQLETYPVITQTGTAARRVFPGPGGRPVATIYYRSEESRIVGPFSQERLVVQSIRLHSYDGHGFETRTVFCDESRSITTVHEVSYRPDGTVEREVERSGGGRLLWEVRDSTRLTYDADGTRIVSIDGFVRDGVDLAQGWGPPAGGLRWGIAASRTAGRADQITIHGTVHDVGSGNATVISGLPQFVLDLELRDAQGGLVAQDSPRLERRRAELIAMNGGRAESLQTIEPGEAAPLDSTSLSDWYSGLPPGRYRLTATRRVDGAQPALASNEIEIEIR